MDRRAFLNVLFPIIWLLLGGYIVYAAYFLVNQRRAVFPRHRIPYDEVLSGPPQDAEVLWIPVQGGDVEAWFFKPLEPGEMHPWPLAVVAHGNGEVVDRWPWKVQGLRERGFAVLLLEYPGYGRSGGSPSEQTVTIMMVQALERLLGRAEIDADRLLYVGRSLGTGAVCSLARKYPPRAILLISPFTSIGAHAVRRFLPPLLVRDPFDNLGFLRGYSGKAMIVHGAKDRLNPLSHARALEEASKDSRLLVYPQSAHHDCPPDWVQLWQDCDAFISEAGFISREGDTPRN